MHILLSIIIFIAGLFFIVKGADMLTDSSASIASKFGISTLVIGMTIVAIGSSAPEFIVSALAAYDGNADMAIGNVVGSNIFNILTIMGATAVLTPVLITRPNIKYDVPFAILSSIIVALMAMDTWFDSTSMCVITRSEGLVMLCIFAIFIGYTLSIARQNMPPDEPKSAEDSKNISVLKCSGGVVLGLTGLFIGGKAIVYGATEIAIALGVSQAIIALTVVSIGTSVPELAASLMAARKGDTAMALGNVIGSVVFNVFFVLGTAAVISPLPASGITSLDIVVLIFSSCTLWYFSKTNWRIVRWEGMILLCIQIIYYALLIMNLK